MYQNGLAVIVLGRRNVSSRTRNPKDYQKSIYKHLFYKETLFIVTTVGAMTADPLFLYCDIFVNDSVIY